MFGKMRKKGRLGRTQEWGEREQVKLLKITHSVCCSDQLTYQVLSLQVKNILISLYPSTNLSLANTDSHGYAKQAFNDAANQ